MVTASNDAPRRSASWRSRSSSSRESERLSTMRAFYRLGRVRASSKAAIKLLTQPGDLVLDLFAGSNTTGEAAESLGRRWLAPECKRDYLIGSAFRFMADWPDFVTRACSPHDFVATSPCIRWSVSITPISTSPRSDRPDLVAPV
ncbi:MAG TPA: DNA methyltransferase [Pirellulales bacterium]|nr:DNA methyltransferase [Pirellulales bacterium]